MDKPTIKPLPVNAPMILTWARIAMIPLVVGIFYLPDAWLAPHLKNLSACILFVLAAITDALDGYLARRFNMTTPMGAFLDPVADKLMVSAALVALLALDRVDMFVALVIIGREIAVSALREWMAQLGAAGRVKVNALGKIKTIAQMVAIPLLLYHDPLFGVINVAWLGTVLVYVAAVLTVYSMLVYLKAARPYLSSE
ncbi:MAG: CDP-diacylglycerol--glycerol-3-phosphate 3-phosphatidyltransferase [Burkholderiaceae bacterium]